MIDQAYSATRTRATWKPRVSDDDLPILRCSACGAVMVGVDGGQPARWAEEGRNPLAVLPYASVPRAPRPCACGGRLTPVPLADAERLPEGLALEYRIVGGMNANAVELAWTADLSRSTVVWAALKTFTGMQARALPPQEAGTLRFLLADEDAYAYCDESPCLECTFMCKRGFVLYALVQPVDGTEPFCARLPLTRMSPYWESRPSEDDSPARSR